MTEANCMLIEMKATTTRVSKQIELLIAELEAVGVDHRNEGWRQMDDAIRTDERLVNLREALQTAKMLEEQVSKIE